MNLNVEIEIVEDIPKDKIEQYVDLVVYGVARGTMDYTFSERRFPYKTGNLQQSSMAQQIRHESNGVYCLDVPEGADYAKYVWQFPQDTTKWTNPETYAQWFATTYNNKMEIITQNAINNAIRSVK